VSDDILIIVSWVHHLSVLRCCQLGDSKGIQPLWKVLPPQFL